MKCEQCGKKGTIGVYSQYGFKHYFCQGCFDQYEFNPLIQQPIAQKAGK